MAAMVGEATEVPPNPVHVLGAPLHDVPPTLVAVSDMQITS